MTKNLTLEEIGKLVGVSRSTVSRVINNQPDVKDDVRERVLQVIKETGYVPNPAARSLAAKHSGILGLVVPRNVATLFGDPYFSRLTQGITQACYVNGYMLSLFLFYTKEDEQMLLPHRHRWLATLHPCSWPRCQPARRESRAPRPGSSQPVVVASQW